MKSKPGRRRTRHVDVWVDEYVNGGLSVYQLAKVYGVPRVNINATLRSRGVLRRTLGYDVENEVYEWLKKKGMNLERQRGDAPFDILCDGMRVDVKSAHLSLGGRYYFAIVHEANKGKNYRDAIDYFYLVFLDKQNRPIYRLETTSVFVRRGLSIGDSMNTKYPIELIGHLDA